MSKDRLYCNQPDRDVPAIECGYPLPCPHHTIVCDGPSAVEDALDVAERIPTQGTKVTTTN